MASEAVREAKVLLVNRLKEIDDERAQLKRALVSLSRSNSKRVGVAGANGQSGVASPRRRRRKRAKRGQRQAEFLAHIQAHPGASVGAAAKEIGVAAPQLYPIARRLSDAGKIKRDGSGFKPA